MLVLGILESTLSFVVSAHLVKASSSCTYSHLVDLISLLVEHLSLSIA